jgi:hypothetical protein
MGKRLKTETQMAELFDENKIEYDRDFQNMVSHGSCPPLKRMFTGRHSRPDFHLYKMQASMNAIVLVGNDEFAHRRYACEFDRIMKITTALSNATEFFNVPVVYIRFNPHFFYKNKILYDPKIQSRHATLLDVIQKIEYGEVVINTNGLSLIYLFYDTDANGELLIFKDVSPENVEFAMALKPCVVKI